MGSLREGILGDFYFCLLFLFASFIKIISRHRFIIKGAIFDLSPLPPTTLKIFIYTTGGIRCTWFYTLVLFFSVTAVVPFSSVYLEVVSVHRECLYSFLAA